MKVIYSSCCSHYTVDIIRLPSNFLWGIMFKRHKNGINVCMSLSFEANSLSINFTVDEYDTIVSANIHLYYASWAMNMSWFALLWRYEYDTEEDTSNSNQAHKSYAIQKRKITNWYYETWSKRSTSVIINATYLCHL